MNGGWNVRNNESDLNITCSRFRTPAPFAIRLATALLVFVISTVCPAQDASLEIEEPLGRIRFGDADDENPSSFAELTGPGDVFDSELPLRRFKKGAIQKISISGGHVTATSPRDLSSSFLAASVGLGIPLGSFDNILSVTPEVRIDWLDAAPGIDVPAQLYQTGLQFFWRKAVDDRWSMMFLVRPSFRGDFTTGDDAFKVLSLGLLTRQCVPETLAMSLGAVYLDRADIPLLPAVGLTWTPASTTRLELRFPESRMSYRIAKNGAASETWFYVSGGLGGNTWAVTRRSGRTDQLTLRDLHLTAGLERVVDGGGGWFLAVGYVFDRRYEYENTNTEISLSDGVLFQSGWSW